MITQPPPYNVAQFYYNILKVIKNPTFINPYSSYLYMLFDRAFLNVAVDTPAEALNHNMQI